jgi:hypothetical protein
MAADTDKKTFRKMFPHLAEELEREEGKVPIDSIRTDPEWAEETAIDEFRHFNPNVIDFIRRCDTEAEAEAIIIYLENRGELSKEYSEELRKQLKEEGVRSFGPKKEENYYFKKAGLC